MSRWSPQNLGADTRAPHGFLASLGKVAQIAAPIAGFLLGGPAGAAVGSAIGQGAAGATGANRQPITGGTSGVPSSVPGASNYSAPGYQGMQAQVAQQQTPGVSPLAPADWQRQAQPFQYSGRPASPSIDNALGGKQNQWGGNPASRYIGMQESLPSMPGEVDPGLGAFSWMGGS